VTRRAQRAIKLFATSTFISTDKLDVRVMESKNCEGLPNLHFQLALCHYPLNEGRAIWSGLPMRQPTVGVEAIECDVYRTSRIVQHLVDIRQAIA
jgi:hypothetical protein